MIMNAIAVQNVFFESDLKVIMELYENQEKLTALVINEANERREKDIKVLTDEQKENYDYWFNDNYHKISTEHPQLIRKTIFLQLYFSFEAHLNKICDHLKPPNINLTYKDIHKNGIIRAEIYLKKVCNVTKPFDSDEWKLIKSFNKLRNSLAHKDGLVDKSNLNPIPNGVIFWKPYKFDTLSEIILSKEFIEIAYDTYIAFTTLLEQQ
ncbi:hypothetical protein NSA31_06340 [Bacillus subtilis]|uniref:hypothetical protein n=1 Tax=Bacillus subtilis TaxID=1423 RepID=UPI00214A050B|nr:hypothetical protein [Bacillus subtilis]MCR1991402.1 hypothetical protein [Bacillus subtilis]